jgi:NADH dehydrogenase/NADH:ubiquinone oxidoreductase subunit G
MSFLSGITDIVSKAVETVAPMALAAIFPPAAMMPGLSNLVTSALGGALSGAIGELGKQGAMPNFIMKEAQDLLGKVVSQLLKPADPECTHHVDDKAGGAIKDLVEQILSQFKDALQNYKGEEGKKGNGNGKGGCGKGEGAGGATGGGIGFRELAAILAELEQKQAKNVQTAVQKATDALGVAKSGEKGDEKKDAEIGANQFKAMEESKAEAQIFQAVSSAVSEVMKNFGGALNTAARGG